jgi:hypothetical protein
VGEGAAFLLGQRILSPPRSESVPDAEPMTFVLVANGRPVTGQARVEIE